MQKKYLVIQAQGIETDDPRKILIGDRTSVKFILFNGVVFPRNCLGAFNSRKELDDFISLIPTREGQVNDVLRKIKASGYHRRDDGSTSVMPNHRHGCNACFTKAKILYGFENNYPKNRDIFLCASCCDEFEGINT